MNYSSHQKYQATKRDIDNKGREVLEAFSEVFDLTSQLKQLEIYFTTLQKQAQEKLYILGKAGLATDKLDEILSAIIQEWESTPVLDKKTYILCREQRDELFSFLGEDPQESTLNREGKRRKTFISRNNHLSKIADDIIADFKKRKLNIVHLVSEINVQLSDYAHVIHSQEKTMLSLREIFQHCIQFFRGPNEKDSPAPILVEILKIPTPKIKKRYLPRELRKIESRILYAESQSGSVVVEELHGLKDQLTEHKTHPLSVILQSRVNALLTRHKSQEELKKDGSELKGLRQDALMQGNLSSTYISTLEQNGIFIKYIQKLRQTITYDLSSTKGRESIGDGNFIKYVWRPFLSILETHLVANIFDANLFSWSAVSLGIDAKIDGINTKKRLKTFLDLLKNISEEGDWKSNWSRIIGVIETFSQDTRFYAKQKGVVPLKNFQDKLQENLP